MSARALRPLATGALAVLPVTVTDQSAPAIVGLEARQFREFLRAERVRHARLGKRVIARVDDVLEALDRVAGRQASGNEPHVERRIEDAEPSADAILARLGYARTPARRNGGAP
ncbi:MAG TPA: hypothetical protein VGY54_01375 [Polyangiaceae bacterium]|nr:hypothetical protein [Polyangiaceae bacterium]